MKKLFLSLSMIIGLSISTQAFAGGVKNLLIETEEAIFSEFNENGRQVESITNYSFTPVKNGIGVKAEVETINPENMVAQSWTCIVTFEKNGNSYSAVAVDCN